MTRVPRHVALRKAARLHRSRYLRRMTSFRERIRIVVALRAGEQVIRIHTGRIVAAVQQAFSRLQRRSAGEFPRHVRGHRGLVSIDKAAVTGWKCVPSPEPARCGFCDVAPELLDTVAAARDALALHRAVSAFARTLRRELYAALLARHFECRAINPALLRAKALWALLVSSLEFVRRELRAACRTKHAAIVSRFYTYWPTPGYPNGWPEDIARDHGAKALQLGSCGFMDGGRQ